MINIQKNDKPAEADIHLKYICHTCGAEHWISLKENQTPKYKIVCYSCDVIIMPKPIQQIKFNFKKEDKPKEKRVKPQIKKDDTVLDVVKRCAITLVSYGFEKDEAMALAEKASMKYNTDSVSDLVKKIIFDCGAIDESKTSEV
tara:strand:- start:293 stop:724 length:432 start_codon:yes stop_codon:yes gene_type:complete